MNSYIIIALSEALLLVRKLAWLEPSIFGSKDLILSIIIFVSSLYKVLKRPMGLKFFI